MTSLASATTTPNVTSTLPVQPSVQPTSGNSQENRINLFAPENIKQTYINWQKTPQYHTYHRINELEYKLSCLKVNLEVMPPISSSFPTQEAAQHHFDWAHQQVTYIRGEIIRLKNLPSSPSYPKELIEQLESDENKEILRRTYQDGAKIA